MNVVDTGSAIRLLRSPHHLTVVVAICVVVTRKTTINSRYYWSWSINSVRLGRHYWRVVFIRTIGDIVSYQMAMEASLVVVGDLTSDIPLSLAISLILISCLGLK
jgi:hypothetical protein